MPPRVMRMVGIIVWKYCTLICPLSISEVEKETEENLCYLTIILLLGGGRRLVKLVEDHFLGDQSKIEIRSNN